MANIIRRKNIPGEPVGEAIRRDRSLRRFLLALAKSVSAAGGAAFLAGGCLRDIVDGKPAADIDVMVAGMSRDALGEALEALPRGRLGIRKVVPAGRHFPVFRVAVAWSARYVDVSTARGGGESRSWPPFACALADAARRDFTVNSLLYELFPKGNRLAGEMIDAFGGIDDLRARTIRCVGSPGDRLREDPLRALRAIRMKNERKGYRIDPATWESIRRQGPRMLPRVSADRLPGELVRSLQADAPGTLEDLRRSGILGSLLPELSRRRSGVDRAVRRARLAARSFRGPIPSKLLLANLLLELTPAQSDAAARRLRLPDLRGILNAASDLRRLRSPDSLRFPLAETERILSRQDAPEPFIALYRAVSAGSGGRAKDLKRFLAYCAKVPFFIDGNDLKRMGAPEGAMREEALLAVREAALGRKIRTREAALEVARRHARKSAGPPGKA